MIIAIIISIIAAVLLIFTIGMSVGERIKEKTIIRRIRIYYECLSDDEDEELQAWEKGNEIIRNFIEDQRV